MHIRAAGRRPDIFVEKVGEIVEKISDTLWKNGGFTNSVLKGSPQRAGFGGCGLVWLGPCPFPGAHKGAKSRNRGNEKNRSGPKS